MRGPEPLRRLAGGGDTAGARRARGADRRRWWCSGSPRTTLVVVGRSSPPSMTPTPSWSRDGFRRLGARTRRTVRALLVPPHRVAAPARAPDPGPGLVAAVPAKLWLRDDGSALLLCAAAYAAELGAGWRERVRRDAARPALGASRSAPTTSSSSAAAATACRPRTTWRPATASPTSPCWSADYIGSGNSGRNTTIIRANYGLPGGRPLLPAQPGAVPAARGRDRLLDHAPTKGHALAGAHPITPPRTERARALLNTGLRRADVIRRAGGDRAASAPRSTCTAAAATRCSVPRTTTTPPPPGTTAWCGRTRRARCGAASTCCRALEVTGLRAGRRPGDGRRDGERARSPPASCSARSAATSPDDSRLGRRAAADPHPHRCRPSSPTRYAPGSARSSARTIWSSTCRRPPAARC